MKSDYSIIEAMEILKISKVTLYRWLNDDAEINNHTKTVKGKRYIAKEGIELLQKRHNLNNDIVQSKHKCDDCIHVTQLEVKDHQIQCLQDSIKELQMELQKMNNSMVGNMEMFQSLIELNRNNQVLLRQALPAPKLNFWDRIFKKK